MFLILLSVVLLLSVFISGCSNSSSDDSSEPTDSTVTTTLAVDNSTGDITVSTTNAPDVDVSTNGLPDELQIPVPPDGKIIMAVSSDGEIGAMLEYSQDAFDELSSFYTEWTAADAAEYEVNIMEFEGPNGPVRTTIWHSTDRTTTITVNDCTTTSGNEFDSVCIGISVRPVE